MRLYCKCEKEGMYNKIYKMIEMAKAEEGIRFLMQSTCLETMKYC